MPDDTTPEQPAMQSSESGAPTGPAADVRPTGPFSIRKVRVIGIAVVVSIFAWLIFIPHSGKKPRAPSLDPQQTQQANNNPSEASRTPDYRARLSDTLSDNARRADEFANRVGAVAQPGYPGYSYPATATAPANYPEYSYTSAGTVIGSSAPRPIPIAAGNQRSLAPNPAGTQSHDPQATAEAAINADMEKREATSAFSALLAISNRSDSNATPPIAATIASINKPGTPSPSPALPPPAQDPGGPVPLTRTTPTRPQPNQPPNSAPASTAHPSRPADDDDLPTPHPNTRNQNASNNATGPVHKLFEGTEIEAVLTNRLNGTYSGPVNCMVTTSVWSQNRQHLLIPAGTRALGEAHKVSGVGQQRLAVTFHRLIMPDGFSVELDKFVGMNQIGETGLKDKVDNHYRQIFGVSIALGAIAGLSVRGTNAGTTQSGTDAWRQGFTSSLSQEATQILDRYLNILPTVIIREGARVTVYLTDDLLLPQYDEHRMSSDL
jgi:type IV secretory pathway VirB10-like protein